MDESLSILQSTKKKRRRRKKPAPLPWYKQKGFIILALLVLAANLGFSKKIDADEYERLAVCSVGILLKQYFDK